MLCVNSRASPHGGQIAVKLETGDVVYIKNVQFKADILARKRVESDIKEAKKKEEERLAFEEKMKIPREQQLATFTERVNQAVARVVDSYYSSGELNPCEMRVNISWYHSPSKYILFEREFYWKCKEVIESKGFKCRLEPPAYNPRSVTYIVVK